jgi:hypothetical protein
MARKLQVLPFLLIFIALPAACAEIRRKQRSAVLNTEAAIYLYPHVVSRYISDHLCPLK